MVWLLGHHRRPVRAWVFLTLIANAIIFISFLLFGAYSAYSQGLFRQEEIEKDIQRIAQSVAASAANDLLSENIDNLESLLKQHIVIGTLQNLSITNSKGKTLLSAVHFISDENEKVDHIEIHYSPTDADNLQRLNDTYTFRSPIYAGREILGWAEASGSLSGLKTLKQQIWINTLIVSLISAAFTCLVFILSLRNFSRALNKIIYFAKDLEHNLDAKINVPSNIQELIILQDALNVTAHTLAQEFQQIQDAEARKTAILEASLDSLITINNEGEIIDFNPSAEKTFGFQKDNVCGKKLSILMLPMQLRDFYEQDIFNFHQTGKSKILHKRIETTAYRADGTKFPVELFIVPFISNNKNYFLSSIRDISTRKQLEETQKHTNLLLNETVHELKLRQTALDEHAIVSIGDPQGNIIYANEKFTDITGYSLDELLGKNHSILHSGVQDSHFYEQLWATLIAGHVWHGELCNRRKDGSLYWVTSTIVPMMNESDHSLTQLISIHTDITANKENEIRLAEYRDYQQTLIDQYQKAEHELVIAQHKEMTLGHQIQRTLLFANIPSHIGCYDLAVHSEPSKGVDGDFYEFFNFGKTGFDIAIADVMGKGITASLIGAAVKQRLNRVVASLTIIHATAGEPIPTPEMIINKLHNRVVDKLISLESFITMFYMRVNTEMHQISYINAGHTKGILITANGLISLSGENLPLGVLPDEHYAATTLPLAEKDLIFLYSDGFTEARNNENEEFGEYRLEQLLTRYKHAAVPPQTIIQGIRKAVYNFSAHSPLSDDRTCIAIYYTGSCCDSGTSMTLQIEWDLARLTSLRQAVTHMGEKFGFQEDALNAINLAVFETATNIIRHNPKPLNDATLDCLINFTDQKLHISFYYLGEPFEESPIEPDFTGNTFGGFGLYIIHQCVDHMERRQVTDGICNITLSKKRE